MKINKRKIIKNLEYAVPRVEGVIDGLLAIESMVLAVFSLGYINDMYGKKLETAILGAIIVAFILVALKFVVMVLKYFIRVKYAKIALQERMSAKTMMQLSAANDSKVNLILRSTYGEVAGWNPIDYRKNVLIYDVHDQLRAILIGLKHLVIDMSEGLSSDKVCVDLIYCYPSKKYNGHIPIHESDKQEEFKKKWKIISSGDTSQCDHKCLDYLTDSKSFYSYVDNSNYVFINDKREYSNTNYLTNKKDSEYDDIGSIVGIVIELKNDCPEEVFVKAILSISTYGETLYQENRDISLEEYKEAFKENVINTYKSLIRSEFAQMFIRHSVRKGRIDPRTGEYRRYKNHTLIQKCKRVLDDNISL